MQKLSLAALEAIQAYIDADATASIDGLADTPGADWAVNHFEKQALCDIAIIDDVIELARRYGLLDETPPTPVTPADNETARRNKSERDSAEAEARDRLFSENIGINERLNNER